MVWERMPWRVALRQERFLPSTDFGPLLFFALRRLARRRASEQVDCFSSDCDIRDFAFGSECSREARNEQMGKLASYCGNWRKYLKKVVTGGIGWAALDEPKVPNRD